MGGRFASIAAGFLLLMILSVIITPPHTVTTSETDATGLSEEQVATLDDLPYSIHVNGKSETTPDWEWAVSAGSANGYDSGHEVVIDSNGAAYVVGYFSETVSFGSASLTSNGMNDIFIAKLSSSGSWIWAIHGGGSLHDTPGGISLDSSGDVYVTGSGSDTGTSFFDSSCNIGTQVLFVAKFSGVNGACLWAQDTINEEDDIKSEGLAIDANGNIYVTGLFSDTVAFGGYSFSPTLTSKSGSTDIFIAKLNNTGSWIWAEKAGESASDNGLGIDTDSNGDIIVTGYFNGNVEFGEAGRLTSIGDDVFVAKLDSSGTWLWAVKAGGTNTSSITRDVGASLTIDSNGDIYVTGDFSETAYFDTIGITSSGLEDIFIAKLSSGGSWLWAVKAGGAGTDYSSGIVVDAIGNVCVIGIFSGHAVFGNTNLYSNGGHDIFTAKLDSSGSWIWAVSAGSSDHDWGVGIGLDSRGDAYVTGHFRNTASFGNIAPTSNGYTDIFIAKLDSNNFPPIPAFSIIDRLEYRGQIEAHGVKNSSDGSSWDINLIRLGPTGDLTVHFDASNSSDGDATDGTNGIKTYIWKVFLDNPWDQPGTAPQGGKTTEVSSMVSHSFTHRFQNITVDPDTGFQGSLIRLELSVIDQTDTSNLQSDKFKMYFVVVGEGYGDEEPIVDFTSPTPTSSHSDDTLYVNGSVVSGSENGDVMVEIALEETTLNLLPSQKFPLKTAGEYDSTVQLADGQTFSLTLDISDLYNENSSTQTIWIKITEGDGSRWTIYDAIDINLLPLGGQSTSDSDSDGIVDSLDLCEGFDDNIDVDSDGIPDGCDGLIDSDSDGVEDSSDACEGFDDNIDVDVDGIPDDCDSLIDSDSDGIADSYDICEGHDDSVDIDGDDIPDGCDILIDSDDDGVENSLDACEGHDDKLDVDSDGIPDDCDPLIDSDGDGVENSLDACEGHNDTIDVDGDGIPYGCDNLIDSDGDGVEDGIDECANSVGYVEQNGCPPSDEEGMSSSTILIVTGSGIGLGSLLVFFAWPGLFGRHREDDELRSISFSQPEPSGPPSVQEYALSPPPLFANGIPKGDGYEWLEWPASSGDWWYRVENTQNQWQHWEN